MTDQSLNTHKDLIVIGGGSAGMAAAIQGVLLGLKVVLFDHAGEDFDKPCGEGLMPQAVEGLRMLGVKIPEFMPFQGISYVSKTSQRIDALFHSSTTGIGVRRRVLRIAMWQRARELGVEIIERRVTKIDEDDNGVSVGGFRASWLCIATGSKDPLIRSLGLQDHRSKKSKPHRTGLRRHARITPWSDRVEVYWSDVAELYITPVAPELVNVAILSWEPISFDDALKLFPEVEARLKGVVWDDQVGGVSPLAHQAKAVQRGRIILAGDAAAFLDAMTGEGNALAILAGITVAQVISRNEVKAYSIRWRKLMWRYWVVTAAALFFSRPGVLRRVSLRMIFKAEFILQMGLRFLSGS